MNTFQNPVVSLLPVCFDCGLLAVDFLSARKGWDLNLSLKGLVAVNLLFYKWPYCPSL